MSRYYNEEFKNEFLNNCFNEETSKYKYDWLFNATSEIENELERDLYTFSTEDYIYLFERCGWYSNNSYTNIKSLFGVYVDYATKNHKIPYAMREELNRLKYDQIDCTAQIKEQFWKNYNAFVLDFNNRFDNNNGFIFNRMRCACGLVWHGLPKEELFTVTKQDLNFQKNTVHSESLDKDILIPESLLSLCSTMADATRYTDPNGKSFALKDGMEILKARECNVNSEAEDKNPGYFLNNFNNVVENSVSFLTPELREYYKHHKYSFKDIEKNGRFERAYMYEATHHKVLSKKAYIEINGKMSSTSVYQELKTYKQWKRAFGL